MLLFHTMIHMLVKCLLFQTCQYTVSLVLKQKNLFGFVLIFLIASTMPDETHFYAEEDFQVILVVYLIPRSVILHDLYNDGRSQFDSACVASPVITCTIQHNLLTSVLGAAALGAVF